MWRGRETACEETAVTEARTIYRAWECSATGRVASKFNARLREER